MIQKTLAQIARETVVTIDDGIDRESGMAVVTVHAAQIAYRPESATTCAALFALGIDGRIYELNNGDDEWGEVPPITRKVPDA